MKNSLSIKSAFGIVFLSLISAFFSGALVIAIGLTKPESSQKFYNFLSFVIGQSFMLVPLLYFLKSKNESIIKRLRLTLVNTNTILNTLFISFGIVVLSDELDRIIQIIWPAPDYILNLNNLLQPETILEFILLFLAIVIIAPLGEELLFRGFLQQILEKDWGDITRAILITSLVFATIHMNVYWFIQIYFLGIILGFLAWKTKSVLPSLILHGINNAMALTFAMIDIEKYSIYIWNGHVAPWFVISSLICIKIGFKNINKIK